MLLFKNNKSIQKKYNPPDGWNDAIAAFRGLLFEGDAKTAGANTVGPARLDELSSIWLGWMRNWRATNGRPYRGTPESCETYTRSCHATNFAGRAVLVWAVMIYCIQTIQQKKEIICMAEHVYLEDSVNARQTEQTEKPVVFLIGDSIRMGYCETVKQELADAAEVVYPEENCRYSQYIITSLRTWSGLCDPDRVKVVQFNCGHWDAAHWDGEEIALNTPEMYQQNIRRIIARLRSMYPNAKIVFATTTPMNPNGENSVNSRTTEEIIRYNEVAVKAVGDCGVKVNDLFAITEDWEASCYEDYCHYTPEFSAVLGRHVAAFLRNEL